MTSPGRVVARAAVAGSAIHARRRPDGVVLARLATVALVAILIALPVARLAGVALESGVATLVATVLSPPVLSAIVASAWTSAAVAVLAVVLGTAAALVTERLGVPGAQWLRLGILAALLVPPFVNAYGWARAFGPRGLLDRWLGLQVPGLYGPLGIVLVLTVAATPLVWLIVAGALASRVEPDAERAARASGAGPWDVLRSVTLPLLRPALLSASVVVFVFAVNAFGVPSVLGTPAGFATITTRLYQDFALSASPVAFVRAITLALTLVVLAVAVVGAADALLAGRSASRTGAAAGSAGRGRGRWLVTLVMGGLLVLFVGVPLVALVLQALTKAAGLAPVPANWTLANFQAALDARFRDGLVNSLLLATAAATVVSIIGSLGAVATRGRARGLGTVVALGFAVPGSALAVAMLLAFGGPLRDTLLLILVAYVAKFWALGHRQLAGSLERLPPELLRAARASGAGPWDAVGSVAAPLLRPSLVAAWLVVFVFALHELTMSSLLYGSHTATLAVVVLNVQQLGDPTVTAALAVLLTGLVGLAAIPLALWTQRRA